VGRHDNRQSDMVYQTDDGDIRGQLGGPIVIEAR
jgi:hypothetical protein